MQKMISKVVGSPSKRQSEVLNFIKKHKTKEGVFPTVAEIGKALSISPPTAHQHVTALRKKNLLVASENGKRRTVQTYDLGAKNSSSQEIPLLGMIAAGGPIEAIRDVRPVEVLKSMVPPGSKYFALRIAGDSMIEDGIPDGSIVIVREQDSSDDGDRVVAYLPDKNEVTLKRLYKERGRFKLVSANKKYKAFYEDNVEVQGKVMGVISAEF